MPNFPESKRNPQSARKPEETARPGRKIFVSYARTDKTSLVHRLALHLMEYVIVTSGQSVSGKRCCTDVLGDIYNTLPSTGQLPAASTEERGGHLLTETIYDDHEGGHRRSFDIDTVAAPGEHGDLYKSIFISFVTEQCLESTAWQREIEQALDHAEHIVIVKLGTFQIPDDYFLAYQMDLATDRYNNARDLADYIAWLFRRQERKQCNDKLAYIMNHVARKRDEAVRENEIFTHTLNDWLKTVKISVEDMAYVMGWHIVHAQQLVDGEYNLELMQDEDIISLAGIVQQRRERLYELLPIERIKLDSPQEPKTPLEPCHPTPTQLMLPLQYKEIRDMHRKPEEESNVDIIEGHKKRTEQDSNDRDRVH